jgi:hypothetical protein
MNFESRMRHSASFATPRGRPFPVQRVAGRAAPRFHNRALLLQRLPRTACGSGTHVGGLAKKLPDHQVSATTADFAGHVVSVDPMLTCRLEYAVP